MSRGQLLSAGAGTGLLVLAADQLSKWWVLYGLDLPRLGSIDIAPFLKLTMVWNQGVTFGLFSHDSPAGAWILGGVALLVVIGLGLWLWRAEKVAVAVALGGIMGGAIGNVIDRARFGAVVDFLHAHAWGWSWYVFNVADAAIVCGVGILVLDSFLPPASRTSHPRLARDAAER